MSRQETLARLAFFALLAVWLLVVLGLVIGARRGWWDRRDLWP